MIYLFIFYVKETTVFFPFLQTRLVQIAFSEHRARTPCHYLYTYMHVRTETFVSSPIY